MLALLGKRKPKAAPVRASRRSIVRDSRGATMLEFTMVAAPLIALIFASLETSLTMFTQQLLDTTTEKLARNLMTGREQLAGTSQTAFKQKLCDDLPTFMKCDKLMVDVQKATDFSTADTSTPTIAFDANKAVTNNWKYQTGSAGDILVMRVMYRWPAVTGPLQFGLANLPTGEQLLMTTAIFKTETYQ
jgi:Flp pilus assembly protein TadG